MSDYQIVMSQTSGMTESERRRRLHAAYQILLDAARKKETTPGGESANLTPGAASDVPATKQDATRSLHP
jgi:hypothetical protein